MLGDNNRGHVDVDQPKAAASASNGCKLQSGNQVISANRINVKRWIADDNLSAD